MDTVIMVVTRVTTATRPGFTTITTNIARLFGTAPASATATSIGGMGISTAMAIGKRGAIRID